MLALLSVVMLLSAPPSPYEDGLRRARQAISENDFAAAAAAYGDALRARPDDARALSGRGYAYMLGGQWAEAKLDLDAALLHADTPQLHKMVEHNLELLMVKRCQLTNHGPQPARVFDSWVAAAKEVGVTAPNDAEARSAVCPEGCSVPYLYLEAEAMGGRELATWYVVLELPKHRVAVTTAIANSIPDSEVSDVRLEPGNPTHVIVHIEHRFRCEDSAQAPEALRCGDDPERIVTTSREAGDTFFDPRTLDVLASFTRVIDAPDLPSEVPGRVVRAGRVVHVTGCDMGADETLP